MCIGISSSSQNLIIRKERVMKKILILGLCVLSSSFAEQVPAHRKDDIPIGDPRRCSVGVNNALLRIEVLPGGGWDNLRNTDMGMISQHNYSKCRTTDDGKYLIPDGVQIISVKTSNVDTSAELFTHWDNFTSSFSRDINVHAGLNLKNVGVSGKFSYEYQDVKSRQHLDKSVTARVQARYVQYTIKLQPDTPVNDAFRSRLNKIAAHIALNNSDLARYESQLLVRDFGSHQLTSIDVGAALMKIDELSASYLATQEFKKTEIMASASASFFLIFNFGTDYSQSATQKQVDAYKAQITSSKIRTLGGKFFKPNDTASIWIDSLQNELVALDRSGDPLHYAVTDVNLPEVPPSIVQEVFEYVKYAVELYYEQNTFRGCTSEESPNFSFAANVDDGSCKPIKTSFTFGGVYQTCAGSGYTDLCTDLTLKNPQTGSMDCPPGYESILIQSDSVTTQLQRTSCHHCWLIFGKCCDTVTDTAYANYQAYWCAATGQVQSNSGFLFGGLYTSKTPNVLTQSQSCPPTYNPMKVFGTTDYLVICVSDDYELGQQYSLPFAGFFSCNTGNPLSLKEREHLLQNNSETGMLRLFMASSGVQTYPKNCPEGYSQHLAIDHEGCNIHFCIRVGSLPPQSLPAVKRPPFVDAPKVAYKNVSFVIGENGQIWTSMVPASQTAPNSYNATFVLQNSESNHAAKRPPYITAPKTGYENVSFVVDENGQIWTRMDPASQTAPNSYNAAQTLQNNDSNPGSLSGGVIAVIAVATTLVCNLAVVGIVLITRRRRPTVYRSTDLLVEDSEGQRINTQPTRGYNHIDNS